MEEAALSPEALPEVKSRPRVPLRCRHCGTCDVPTFAPGVGPHTAKALCAGCGRFLRWLPKALLWAPKERLPMVGMNSASIVGRLTRAPVVRVEDERQLTTFTLAVE